MLYLHTCCHGCHAVLGSEIWSFPCGFQEALESAMSSGLWGHALFLASKMDNRSYTTVLNRWEKLFETWQLQEVRLQVVICEEILPLTKLRYLWSALNFCYSYKEMWSVFLSLVFGVYPQLPEFQAPWNAAELWSDFGRGGIVTSSFITRCTVAQQAFGPPHTIIGKAAATEQLILQSNNIWKSRMIQLFYPIHVYRESTGSQPARQQESCMEGGSSSKTRTRPVSNIHRNEKFELDTAVVSALQVGRLSVCQSVSWSVGRPFWSRLN